jgi:hypothetical protein
MLIYLDAQIVQYCADYEDFLFDKLLSCPVGEPNLRTELYALRRLIELEQFGDWTFAASELLLTELHRGVPTQRQRAVYKLLEESFSAYEQPDERVLQEVAEELASLQLKDAADRRHLANAVAVGSSWFITNDNDILRKTSGGVRTTRVARPSECLAEISVGLFLQ